MAGEMTQSEVTREAYPLHFAIADRFNGEVRAFDQYQGPYVRCAEGKFWINSDDGIALHVWNERTQKQSSEFLLSYRDEIDNAVAVEAAEETL